jgi:hypothetical protein
MNARTLVLSLLLVLVAGCESKVDQCNAFIDEANDSQNAYVALEGAIQSPASIKQRTDHLDASSKKLTDLKLGDAKLKDFRDRYVKQTDDFSAGLKKLGTLPPEDPSAAKIGKDLDDLAEKQDKLIAEINLYCTGVK